MEVFGRLKPTVILDIGSSKVVCLIGSKAKHNGVAIYGSGVAAYPGYAEGVFTDEKALAEAVVTAVRQAEDAAKYRIREMGVGVPAPFSKLLLSSATVNLGPEKRRVTNADINEQLMLSLEKLSAPGYRPMHGSQIVFTVEGEETIESPLDMKLSEFSATDSHLFVTEYFATTLTSILDELSIACTGFVSATLAEALMLIPEEERLRPAVMIDVGYLHTDVAVAEGGGITNLTTLDLGGMQFASDLAYGLDIPPEYAEQVKRKYSFLQDEETDVETIHMPTGVKRVRRDVIDLIIEARAGEFTELILKSLEQMGIKQELKPVLYVTGGGFLTMRGGAAYLRQALGFRIKCDTPSTRKLETPYYSSAFGVLDFFLRNGTTESSYASEDEEEPRLGIISRIKNLFSK